MNKYIGENRLTYLWGKIKAFVSNAISGKVDKVSSSTDNAVVRFDGTSGNIQNSGVTINDNNHLTAAKLITSGGTSSQFVKGDGSLDNNAYAGAQTSGGAANKAVSIPFGQVDSTSTSTAFTATVDGITELRDGVCVYLKNGVVTSAASCTLNVNGLGAKPMYNTMAATTAISTQWGINYTMLFIYNSTRVSGGCWDMFYGYYSDTNSIGYQLRTNSYTLPVSDTNRFYKIFFTSADNTKWVPASADTTNNTTSAKPVNQRPINPFGPIVYVNSSTNFTAGTNVTVNVIYQQIPLTLGYSFNRTGAALTLTIGKPVFIKCAPQDDGSAIIDANTPYVQDLPTSEDGMIYIFLGVAYSATAVELQMVHPVYYYKNGSINLWTGTGVQTDVSKSTESNVIDVGAYDLMKINEVKGKSLVMNQLANELYYYTSLSTPLTKDVDGVYSKTDASVYLTVKISFHANHKYLLLMEYYDSNSGINLYYGTSFGSADYIIRIRNLDTTKYNHITYIITPSADKNNLSFGFGSSVSHTVYVKNPMLIDLTRMFGAGNEPTTVEEVEAILGNDYYEYNTGEVVGNNVEKLDVYDSNDTKKGSLALNLTELTGKVRGEWNQRAKNPNPSITNNTEWRAYNNSNVSIEYVDDGVKATILNEGYGYSRGLAVNCTGIANTHKYFAIIIVKPSVTHDFNFETGNGQAVVSSCTANQWNKVAGIVTASRNEAQLLIVKPATSNLSVNDTFTVRFASLVDLTQMFGAGNEPTSVEQCLMMFPNEYYPYNAGEVNSDDISGIIYSDGLHGVGTVYDSLIVDDDGYARKAVKRMAKVDIGTFTWKTSYTKSRFYASLPADATVYTAINNVFKNTYFCDKYTKSTTLTDMTDKTTFLGNNSYMYAQDSSYSTAADFKTAMDGVMLYYELATPIEYVLDTPVQCVAKVYPNGTVKQVPVMPDSTPMVMNVTYLHDNGLYATKEYVNTAIEDKADSATTLAGYGITDAKIESGVITLGSNTITPLTSHQDISGKVDKVSSTTDDAIVRFDGSTGAIQNSSATVSDNGSVTVYDLVVHGDNDTNNTRMISSSNATNLVFRVESTAKMVINPSRITTGTGQTVDLGSSSIPWNNVYGASFITTGGTSSQFVKGDGSLDSNTYATKSYVDNIVGDIETLLASI